MREAKIYNPLEEINVGGNIAVELIDTKFRILADHKPSLFEGGGVYALYYWGPNELYKEHRYNSCERWGKPFRPIFPIYVGSSFAVGTKRGLQGFRDQTGSRNALGKRISEHAGTIRKSSASVHELAPSDFAYRALPLNDVHIGLAEATLITFFRPVWNGTGFGNHVPGGGRPSKANLNAFHLLHAPKTIARQSGWDQRDNLDERSGAAAI